MNVHTAALLGIDSVSVLVEVKLFSGRSDIQIIGLADNAVKEARGRVESAILSTGFDMPKGRVLVSLSPGELRKEGTRFDLPIALAILSATGQVASEALAGSLFIGELALNGDITPVRGAISTSIFALQHKYKRFVLPAANLKEARLISGVDIVGVSSLKQLGGYLRGDEIIDVGQEDSGQTLQTIPHRYYDFAEVCGQETAKRAMTIAAAGGHNLLLIGPPGCGKSMLSERMPTILPPLSQKERLEVAKIHSAVGLELADVLAGVRPFRAPHHVISDIGLIGGGSQIRPGEISLSHNGVLFLDEFPEYRRSALESMRSPLEAGRVRISRARGSIEFPANFQLVAAMNPCPCGRLGSIEPKCSCSHLEIKNYLKKLSQPILDRIDLHVEVKAVPLAKIADTGGSHSSSESEKLRHAIIAARTRAIRRQGRINSQLSAGEISRQLGVKRDGVQLITAASERFNFSARTYVRILRTAATISDLAGGDSHIITRDHINEALSYRILERYKSLLGVGGQ